jgi:hypothetical protein
MGFTALTPDDLVVAYQEVAASKPLEGLCSLDLPGWTSQAIYTLPD